MESHQGQEQELELVLALQELVQGRALVFQGMALALAAVQEQLFPVVSLFTRL